jgi:hypothetical protein
MLQGTDAARNQLAIILSRVGRSNAKNPLPMRSGSHSSSGLAQIVVASAQTPPWLCRISTRIWSENASGSFGTAAIRAKASGLT